MPKKLFALCLSCQSGAEFKVLCPEYLSCQYCIRSWLLVIRARNKNIILLLGMDVDLFPGRNDLWQSARGIDDLCPECNLFALMICARSVVCFGAGHFVCARRVLYFGTGY